MIKTIKEWKMYKESILVPRNLDGRDEKLRQKWYRLFQQEVIEAEEVEISIDLDLDPSKVKTKKNNWRVKFNTYI